MYRDKLKIVKGSRGFWEVISKTNNHFFAWVFSTRKEARNSVKYGTMHHLDVPLDYSINPMKYLLP